MTFYADGRKERDFEAGVAAAIEALLVSPQFVFRLEGAAIDTPRSGGAASRTAKASAARPADLQLASRLSFFLWGTAPDADLLKTAGAGRMRATAASLDAQVKRMLADPRSEALSTRFATQWLRLNDVDDMLPDAILYPYFDRTLGDAFVRETQLFFDS